MKSLIKVSFLVAVFLVLAGVAQAVGLYSNASVQLNEGSPDFSSGTIDASGHENLVFSFSYEAETMDNGDSFTYGWSAGGTDHDLGTISGADEGSAGDETDSVTETLPVEAQAADLELYIRATVDSGSDEANISSIDLSGDVVATATITNDEAESYTTIQEAIDGTDANGVITVPAGTYNESPNITKSLTLQSADGRDVTTIMLQTGPTYLGSLTIGASDVTVSGFTIQGFDGGSGLASTNVFLNSGIDNVTLTNNSIKVGQIGSGSNGDDGIGLVTTYTEDSGQLVGNLTVTNNIFEPADALSGGSRAFFINTGVNNFTFSGNTITGKFTRGSYTQAQNGLVQNNTVTGEGTPGSRSSSIGTWGYPDPTVWGHTTFSGNTISGVQGGIYVLDTNNVTISGNNLSGNGTGIWVEQDGFTIDSNTISITNNNLSNQDDFGIELFGSFSLTASPNWWGVTASSSVEALAEGDVDFDPWFMNEEMTILSTVGPTITLNGDASMSVFTSNGFIDPGASAADSIGRALPVMTTGTVLDDTPGTYTLTYSATDENGLQATTTRTVLVRQASSGGGGGSSLSDSSGEVLGTAITPEGTVIAGEVFGLSILNLSEAERQAQIGIVTNQLISKINELIALLQAQLAAAIQAGN